MTRVYDVVVKMTDGQKLGFLGVGETEDFYVDLEQRIGKWAKEKDVKSKKYEFVELIPRDASEDFRRGTSCVRP